MSYVNAMQNTSLTTVVRRFHLHCTVLGATVAVLLEWVQPGREFQQNTGLL